MRKKVRTVALPLIFSVELNSLLPPEESDLASVKLTFNSRHGSTPDHDDSLNYPMIGDAIRNEASDVQQLLEKKQVALEKLGRARQAIEVARGFLQIVSDVSSMLFTMHEHFATLRPADSSVFCAVDPSSCEGRFRCFRYALEGDYIIDFYPFPCGFLPDISFTETGGTGENP